MKNESSQSSQILLLTRERETNLVFIFQFLSEKIYFYNEKSHLAINSERIEKIHFAESSDLVSGNATTFTCVDCYVQLSISPWLMDVDALKAQFFRNASCKHKKRRKKMRLQRTTEVNLAKLKKKSWFFFRWLLEKMVINLVLVQCTPRFITPRTRAVYAPEKFHDFSKKTMKVNCIL